MTRWRRRRRSCTTTRCRACRWSTVTASSWASWPGATSCGPSFRATRSVSRSPLRPTRAEIDLGAIRANTATLVEEVAPSAVLAVVKADGYGHGAVPAATAAVDAGATWLGVALVEEGVESARRRLHRTDPGALRPPPHGGDRPGRAGICGHRLQPRGHRGPGPRGPGSGGRASRASQGRHRHAPGRGSTLRCLGAGPCRGRCSSACAWRVCAPTWQSPTNPPARTPAPSSPLSRRCAGPWALRVFAHRWCMRPTRRAPSCIRPAATTWCVAGSPSTESPPSPGWRDACR